MAFIFTCGTHTFSSLLAGYENVTVRCANCGNFSGRIYKRWEWFTFCFIPVIPFSIKPDHDVGCHICNFYQDLRYRPDVEQARQGGGGAGGQAIPMHNGPPQGWGQQQQMYYPQYPAQPQPQSPAAAAGGGGGGGGAAPQASGAIPSGQLPQYK